MKFSIIIFIFTKINRKREYNVSFWEITISLAKVSDRNSFRANQNYSDSFRYVYRSQCKSFRTNPKNVLWLVLWKTVKNRSNLIRFNPRQQSEWIRFNPKPSFYFEPIRARIHPNRIFNQNQSKWIWGRNDSDWFWSIRIENLVSCWFWFLWIVASD